MNKPRARDNPEKIQTQGWEIDEAKTFLQATHEAGPQPAAFYLPPGGSLRLGCEI